MITVKNMILVSPFHYTLFTLGFLFFFWGGISFASAQERISQNVAADSQEISINMESYVFSPSEITVKVGEPITLILNNQSFLVPHNFLLDDPKGIRVLDADISSGESQTYPLTLFEAGVYSFYCDKQLLFFPTHREEGMEGRLIVK